MFTILLSIIFAIASFFLMMTGVFWINAWASKTKSDFTSNLRQSLRCFSYVLVLGLCFAGVIFVFGDTGKTKQGTTSETSILK